MQAATKGEALELVREKRALDAWLHVFGWGLVGAISFAGAAYAAGFVIRLLLMMNAPITASTVSAQLLVGLVMYVSTAGILVSFAWWRRNKFTTQELGLSRLLEWRDIGFALAGAVLYLVAATLALKVATAVPGFDGAQPQETGLGALFGWNRAIAFVSLAVLAPVAEEVIFRGMLYGRMRRANLPWWTPALVVSALFGVVHLQWNVGIDVFCLSFVLCALREVTGSIWSGILVHILKNSIAFFVVFSVMGV